LAALEFIFSGLFNPSWQRKASPQAGAQFCKKRQIMTFPLRGPHPAGAAEAHIQGKIKLSVPQEESEPLSPSQQSQNKLREEKDRGKPETDIRAEDSGATASAHTRLADVVFHRYL
jgi:hypothetical protein